MPNTTDNIEQEPGLLSGPIVIHEVGNTDLLSDESISQIGKKLGQLSLEEDTVLADHQRDAFDSVVDFYQKGGRECYVELPTGTGKTVLFVEVCKRLIESTPEGEQRSRVIVLVPSKNLVTQTIGGVDAETGKKRGFKGFAPEIDARPFTSDIPDREKNKNMLEADVVVATYSMFRSLVGSFERASEKTTEEWHEQKHKYGQLLDQAIIDRDNLVNDRRKFIRDSYVSQELRSAKSNAKEILEQNQEDGLGVWLSKIELKDLEEIISIVDREDEPNATKLRELRKFFKGLANDQVKSGITWLNKQYKTDKDGNTVEETQSKKPKYDPVNINELNPLDKLVATFLWRHSRKRGVQSSELYDIETKNKVFNYNDQIETARGKVVYLKGRMKSCDRMVMLREAGIKFDLIVCDEAHRSIGSDTWDSIRQYASRKDIAIFGLTATDKYFDRSLEDYFEQKAHELTKQEAIRQQIVNPVSMFVYDTGMRFSGVGIDASGDYDRLTLRSMRHNHERNMIGVDLAKTLVELGYRGIVPCIAGDEGAHAKEMETLLNATLVTDPKTGKERYMRAAHILGTTDDKVLEECNRALDAGELDWITFIDVIREGWDSDPAKAILNMRPSRSFLLATQRLGRIGRTYPGAPISIAIDLWDGISGDGDYIEIPPVTVADVYNLDNIEQGYIVGPDGHEISDPVIDILKSKMPKNIIIAYHNRFLAQAERANLVDYRGIARNKHGDPVNDLQTYESIIRGFSGFLPKKMLEEAAEGENPLVRSELARKGSFKTVMVYNVKDILHLHEDKPVINPWKLYVDSDNQQWITPEGCTKMLSKKMPTLYADDIDKAIEAFEKKHAEKLSRNIGRIKLTFHDADAVHRYGLTYMYRLDEIIEKLVPFLLEARA